MSDKETGGSAFPKLRKLNSPSHEYMAETVGGMTLRDYFAAKATAQDVQAWSYGGECLQIRRNLDGTRSEFTGPKPYTREEAKYRYADAMLKARVA